MKESVVAVERLSVVLESDGARIIDEVSLCLDAGETLGLVGESGSGKTALALALLGFARRGTRIESGVVRVAGDDMVSADERTLRHLRGRVISYVPQDPGTALNPARRVGKQLTEMVAIHRSDLDPRAREQRLRSVLDEVELADVDDLLRRYPHQLSGGQQQRVTLALAFISEPAVVVLDEPTTGLDVTTQARILATVRQLCDRHRTAALFVSHDLAVVRSVADRTAVLYSGRVAEMAPTSELFAQPAHRYTGALLGSAPDASEPRHLVGIPGRAPRPRDRPEGCAFAPRCGHADERCLSAPPALTELRPGHVVACYHPSVAGSVARGPLLPPRTRSSPVATLSAKQLAAGYSGRDVLSAVDLTVSRAGCVALVGESGSGKSTLARCLVGLHSPSGGQVVLDGAPLAATAAERPAVARRSIQYVFQNPYASLNPRKTGAEILLQPLRAFGLPYDQEILESSLRRVALGADTLRHLPGDLSGGERQRLAIARALIVQPEFLVCDEVTSSLDVSVQAAIVDLLDSLRRDYQLGVLFVTHNLPLVRAIADEIIVLRRGEVVEAGPTTQVLEHPASPYTLRLLDAIPGSLRKDVEPVD